MTNYINTDARSVTQLPKQTIRNLTQTLALNIV